MKTALATYTFAALATLAWPTQNVAYTAPCPAEKAIVTSLKNQGMRKTFEGRLNGRLLHSVWKDDKNRWIIIHHKRNKSACIVSAGENK